MTRHANTEKPGTTLQTVERAFTFLEIVARSPQPLRTKDVAMRLGINTTTSYHLLNTLLRTGYLARNPDGTLRIGNRAGLLYDAMVRTLSLGQELRPIVERLALETQETTYVNGITEEGAVIQALIDGRHAVRVTGLYLGFSGFEHIRASGKAVLAFLRDPRRENLIQRSLAMAEGTAYPRVTRAKLDAELEQVRRDGWAIDEGQFQAGVSCVAAPFFYADETVGGSIAVSAPSTRFAHSKATIVDLVRRAAEEASMLLGHRPRAELAMQPT